MTEVLELKEELLQIKNNNYAVPEDDDIRMRSGR